MSLERRKVNISTAPECRFTKEKLLSKVSLEISTSGSVGHLVSCYTQWSLIPSSQRNIEASDFFLVGLEFNSRRHRYLYIEISIDTLAFNDSWLPSFRSQDERKMKALFKLWVTRVIDYIRQWTSHIKQCWLALHTWKHAFSLGSLLWTEKKGSRGGKVSICWGGWMIKIYTLDIIVVQPPKWGL